MPDLIRHPARDSAPTTDRPTQCRFTRMKSYAVYILARRKRGTLYVGVTSDIAARVRQHRQGCSAFTRKHGLDRLVHVEFHGDVHEAIAREKRLKRWRRQWKYELIEAGNPDWQDLYATLNQ